MRDLKDLQKFWYDNIENDKILCTIIGKSGSGYRGLGAKKIILKNGKSCGYLSGGCLEGDIICTALNRQSELPFVKSFSTMSKEDRLMGYQTGCAGIIDILFEKLPGHIEDMHLYLPYGERDDLAGIAVSLNDGTLGQRTILKKGEEQDTHFVDEWVRPFKLYILGCGGNAYPYGELAPSLGWDVIFLDYRDGNIIKDQNNITSKVVPLNDFHKYIEEGQRSAVIVMTHNYEADLDLIRQLNKKYYGYIGFVGPKKRFEQLREDSKKLHGIDIDHDWAEQVYAPAGMAKGRTPEHIAFSIIAQIQFEVDT